MITKLIPRKVFFTSGVGTHPEHLESFEVALRNAGIEKFNLVTVSSILPPNCEIVSREEGLKELSPGEIVFCVMSRISSNEPRRMLSTSVGCALPQITNKHGYISEYHAYGETATGRRGTCSETCQKHVQLPGQMKHLSGPSAFPGHLS